VRFFKRLDPINADLSVLLDKPMFNEGEALTGKLVLSSDEAVHADEIRLEVRVTETYETPTYTTIGNRVQPTVQRQTRELYADDVDVSGPLDISKGYKGEFPFTTNVIPPIRATMGGLIDRKIKGVVAVKGRPDKTKEIGFSLSPVPFAVITQAPAQAPKVRCKYCNKLTPTDTKCQNCGAPL
jgi:hypothetical protein